MLRDTNRTVFFNIVQKEGGVKPRIKSYKFVKAFVATNTNHSAPGESKHNRISSEERELLMFGRAQYCWVEFSIREESLKKEYYTIHILYSLSQTILFSANSIGCVHCKLYVDIRFSMNWCLVVPDIAAKFIIARQHPNGCAQYWYHV